MSRRSPLDQVAVQCRTSATALPRKPAKPPEDKLYHQGMAQIMAMICPKNSQQNEPRKKPISISKQKPAGRSGIVDSASQTSGKSVSAKTPVSTRKTDSTKKTESIRKAESTKKTDYTKKPVRTDVAKSEAASDHVLRNGVPSDNPVRAKPTTSTEKVNDGDRDDKQIKLKIKKSPTQDGNSFESQLLLSKPAPRCIKKKRELLHYQTEVLETNNKQSVNKLVIRRKSSAEKPVRDRKRYCDKLGSETTVANTNKSRNNKCGCGGVYKLSKEQISQISSLNCSLQTIAQTLLGRDVKVKLHKSKRAERHLYGYKHRTKSIQRSTSASSDIKARHKTRRIHSSDDIIKLSTTTDHRTDSTRPALKYTYKGHLGKLVPSTESEKTTTELHGHKPKRKKNSKKSKRNDRSCITVSGNNEPSLKMSFLNSPMVGCYMDVASGDFGCTDIITDDSTMTETSMALNEEPMLSQINSTASTTDETSQPDLLDVNVNGISVAMNHVMADQEVVIQDHDILLYGDTTLMSSESDLNSDSNLISQTLSDDAFVNSTDNVLNVSNEQLVTLGDCPALISEIDMQSSLGPQKLTQDSELTAMESCPVTDGAGLKVDTNSSCTDMPLLSVQSPTKDNTVRDTMPTLTPPAQCKLLPARRSDASNNACLEQGEKSKEKSEFYQSYIFPGNRTFKRSVLPGELTLNITIVNDIHHLRKKEKKHLHKTQLNSNSSKSQNPCLSLNVVIDKKLMKSRRRSTNGFKVMKSGQCHVLMKDPMLLLQRKRIRSIISNAIRYSTGRHKRKIHLRESMHKDTKRKRTREINSTEEELRYSSDQVCNSTSINEPLQPLLDLVANETEATNGDRPEQSKAKEDTSDDTTMPCTKERDAMSPPASEDPSIITSLMTGCNEEEKFSPGCVSGHGPDHLQVDDWFHNDVAAEEEAVTPLGTALESMESDDTLECNNTEVTEDADHDQSETESVVALKNNNTMHDANDDSEDTVITTNVVGKSSETSEELDVFDKDFPVPARPTKLIHVARYLATGVTPSINKGDSGDTINNTLLKTHCNKGESHTDRNAKPTLMISIPGAKQAKNTSRNVFNYFSDFHCNADDAKYFSNQKISPEPRVNGLVCKPDELMLPSAPQHKEESGNIPELVQSCDNEDRPYKSDVDTQSTSADDNEPLQEQLHAIKQIRTNRHVSPSFDQFSEASDLDLPDVCLDRPRIIEDDECSVAYSNSQPDIGSDSADDVFSDSEDKSIFSFDTVVEHKISTQPSSPCDDDGNVDNSGCESRNTADVQLDHTINNDKPDTHRQCTDFTDDIDSSNITYQDTFRKFVGASEGPTSDCGEDFADHDKIKFPVAEKSSPTNNCTETFDLKQSVENDLGTNKEYASRETQCNDDDSDADEAELLEYVPSICSEHYDTQADATPEHIISLSEPSSPVPMFSNTPTDSPPKDVFRCNITTHSKTYSDGKNIDADFHIENFDSLQKLAIEEIKSDVLVQEMSRTSNFLCQEIPLEKLSPYHTDYLTSDNDEESISISKTKEDAARSPKPQDVIDYSDEYAIGMVQTSEDAASSSKPEDATDYPDESAIGMLQNTEDVTSSPKPQDITDHSEECAIGMAQSTKDAASPPTPQDITDYPDEYTTAMLQATEDAASSPKPEDATDCSAERAIVSEDSTPDKSAETSDDITSTEIEREIPATVREEISTSSEEQMDDMPSSHVDDLTLQSSFTIVDQDNMDMMVSENVELSCAIENIENSEFTENVVDTFIEGVQSNVTSPCHNNIPSAINDPDSLVHGIQLSPCKTSDSIELDNFVNVASTVEVMESEIISEMMTNEINPEELVNEVEVATEEDLLPRFGTSTDIPNDTFSTLAKPIRNTAAQFDKRNDIESTNSYTIYRKETVNNRTQYLDNNEIEEATNSIKEYEKVIEDDVSIKTVRVVEYSSVTTLGKSQSGESLYVENSNDVTEAYESYNCTAGLNSTEGINEDTTEEDKQACEALSSSYSNSNEDYISNEIQTTTNVEVESSSMEGIVGGNMETTSGNSGADETAYINANTNQTNYEQINFSNDAQQVNDFTQIQSYETQDETMQNDQCQMQNMDGSYGEQSNPTNWRNVNIHSNAEQFLSSENSTVLNYGSHHEGINPERYNDPLIGGMQQAPRSMDDGTSKPNGCWGNDTASNSGLLTIATDQLYADPGAESSTVPADYVDHNGTTSDTLQRQNHADGKKPTSKKKSRGQKKQKKDKNVGNPETGDRLEQEFGGGYNWLENKINSNSTPRHQAPKTPTEKPVSMPMPPERPSEAQMVNNDSPAMDNPDEHMITVAVNATQPDATAPTNVQLPSNSIGDDFGRVEHTRVTAHQPMPSHMLNTYNNLMMHPAQSNMHPGNQQMMPLYNHGNDQLPMPTYYSSSVQSPSILAPEVVAAHQIFNIESPKQTSNNIQIGNEHRAFDANHPDRPQSTYSMISNDQPAYSPHSASLGQHGANYNNINMSTSSGNAVLTTAGGIISENSGLNNQMMNTNGVNNNVENGNKDENGKEVVKPKILKVQPQRQQSLPLDNDIHPSQYNMNSGRMDYYDPHRSDERYQLNNNCINSAGENHYGSIPGPRSGHSMGTPSPLSQTHSPQTLKNEYNTFNINEHLSNREAAPNDGQLPMLSPVGHPGRSHYEPNHGGYPNMYNPYERSYRRYPDMHKKGGMEDPLSGIIVQELKEQNQHQSMTTSDNEKILHNLGKGLESYPPGKMMRGYDHRGPIPIHTAYNKHFDHMRSRPHDIMNLIPTSNYKQQPDHPSHPEMMRHHAEHLHHYEIRHDRHPMDFHLHQQVPHHLRVPDRTMEPNERHGAPHHLMDHHPMHHTMDPRQNVHNRFARDPHPVLSRHAQHNPYSNPQEFSPKHGSEMVVRHRTVRNFHEPSMHRKHMPPRGELPYTRPEHAVHTGHSTSHRH